jgi:acetylornithine deacetylase/succinyl-diaminopimelate desuccinylase-like protein
MRFALFVFMLFLSAAGFAQQVDAVLSQARTQKGPLLDTLKELVSIESGSRDLEGLERIAQLIAERLKSLGGEVELVEPADVYKMEDTPQRIGRMVRGTFKGSGAKRTIALKVYGKASHGGAAMAKHAQAIYKELRQELLADALAEGGGTDAAFAALKTKNAVVERFGLRGFGAHSTDDEYVLVSSIEPRLYLAARLIMDLARDRLR